MKTSIIRSATKIIKLHAFIFQVSGESLIYGIAYFPESDTDMVPVPVISYCLEFFL